MRAEDGQRDAVGEGDGGEGVGGAEVVDDVFFLLSLAILGRRLCMRCTRICRRQIIAREFLHIRRLQINRFPLRRRRRRGVCWWLAKAALGEWCWCCGDLAVGAVGVVARILGETAVADQAAAAWKYSWW